MKIDKKFFKKYQKPILWLANSFIGKKFFQFEKMGHELRKGEKINRITANSIRYKNKDNSYTEQFFGRNEYALKLAPLVWWMPIELESGEFKSILKPIYQLILIALFIKFPKGLPLLGLSTTTDFYSSNSYVDGRVQRHGKDEVLTTILDGAGTHSYSLAASALEIPQIYSTGTQDQYYSLVRGVLLFNTSDLTSDATISSASLFLYGKGRRSGLGKTDFNVYASTPASNNALVDADYDNFGTTAYCDTDIDYDGFKVADWNEFSFNSTGKTAVSKTSVTKLGLRLATIDVGRTEPSGWVSNNRSGFEPYMRGSANHKPKLTVTYTLPATDVPVSEQALVLTLPAPTVNYDYELAVSEQALVLTQGTPTIVIGQVFLASALQLSLSQQSPTLNYDYGLDVSELKLALTQPAPTVAIDIIEVLTALGLELAQISPDILWNACAEPDALRLGISLYDPILLYWQKQTKHTATWTNSAQSTAPTWVNKKMH